MFLCSAGLSSEAASSRTGEKLVRIRIYLPDRPGALAELSSVIAGQGANIVELLFNRAYYGVSLGDTAIDDHSSETRGATHLSGLPCGRR